VTRVSLWVEDKCIENDVSPGAGGLLRRGGQLGSLVCGLVPAGGVRSVSS